MIIECVVDPHEPPMPAKILREGTPNRNRVALQMVKDTSGAARKIRDLASDEHPE